MSWSTMVGNGGITLPSGILLRHNAGIRAGYADLKRELAKLYPNDREAYAARKTDFIRNVLDMM